MVQILIDKKIFVTIVQSIIKLRDKRLDEKADDGTIRYFHRDLSFEARKENGKIIPTDVIFAMLGETYYLRMNGKVSVFEIDSPYEEEEFDLEDQEEIEMFSEVTHFKEINEDESLMNVMKNYLDWRVKVLEEIEV